MSSFHQSPTPDKWSLMANAWIDPEIHRPFIGLATRDRHGGDVVELKSGELSKVLILLDEYAERVPIPSETRISDVLDLCATDEGLAYFRVWGEASTPFGPIKAEEYREALMWISCPCCGRKMKAVNLLKRWEGNRWPRTSGP